MVLWGVHTGEALACEGCGAASGRGRGSTFQGIISDLPGVAAQLCAFIATLFDRVWFRLIRSRWHLGCCDSRVATGSRLWTRVVCMGIRNWMGRFGCHAAVSGLGEGNSSCAPRRHFWALHLSEYISLFFCKSSLLRINQRHHSLGTRLGTHHLRQ